MAIEGDFIATALIETIVIATGTPPIGPGIEVGGVRESKSTVDSVTDVALDTFGEARASVRLCRVGATFQTLRAPFAGGGYGLHREWQRPDLPHAMLVGVFASDSGNPDIGARVHSITFRRPSSVADCTAP